MSGKHELPRSDLKRKIEVRPSKHQMSTLRDANTKIKGSLYEKKLSYILSNRNRGNKKIVKRKRKPFKIKFETTYRSTTTARVLSSVLRDANTRSHKSVKGSPTKKKLEVSNLTRSGKLQRKPF